PGCAIYRSCASGAGSDRYRYRLCYDCAFPCRVARIARNDTHRPCRRQGELMMDWKSHLIVAPILLPLVTAALLLMFDERKRKLKMAINTISIMGLIYIAYTLLGVASEKAPDASV